MLMPGSSDLGLRRQYSLGGYDHRYGFNGKEGDDEVKGDDNQVDFGGRILDPRVGRWMSVDPSCVKYPSFSTYQSNGNNPILQLDPDGKDNIVYFILTGKTHLSKTDVKRLEFGGNFILSHNNINAQVKVLSYDGQKGAIDVSLLDPTDQIIYIGEGNNINKLSIVKNEIFTKSNENTLYGYSFTETNVSDKVGVATLTPYSSGSYRRYLSTGDDEYKKKEKELQKIYNAKDDKMIQIGITAIHEMGHNVLNNACHTGDPCYEHAGGTMSSSGNIMQSGAMRANAAFPFQQSPEVFAFLSGDKLKIQKYFKPSIRIKDNFSAKFKEKYNKK